MKLDGETYTSYALIYTWNLKKGYERTYLQNRNRLTDFKNLMVTNGDKLRGRYILGFWDGNLQQLGCDGVCTTINIIKFIKLKKIHGNNICNFFDNCNTTIFFRAS